MTAPTNNAITYQVFLSQTQVCSISCSTGSYLQKQIQKNIARTHYTHSTDSRFPRHCML